MVLQEIQHNSPQYQQMLSLRIKVLLNPIGIPATYIDVEREKKHFLLGAFEGDLLQGCCVLTPLDATTIQLRQMAVHTEKQGKGLGAMLLRFAEQTAATKGYQLMVLHARSNVTSFYAKIGYQITGEPFEEVGIPHRKMQKRL